MIEFLLFLLVAVIGLKTCMEYPRFVDQRKMRKLHKKERAEYRTRKILRNMMRDNDPLYGAGDIDFTIHREPRARGKRRDKGGALDKILEMIAPYAPQLIEWGEKLFKIQMDGLLKHPVAQDEADARAAEEVLQEIKDGKQKTIPWDQVKSEIPLPPNAIRVPFYPNQKIAVPHPAPPVNFVAPPANKEEMRSVKEQMDAAFKELVNSTDEYEESATWEPDNKEKTNGVDLGRYGLIVNGAIHIEGEDLDNVGFHVYSGSHRVGMISSPPFLTNPAQARERALQEERQRSNGLTVDEVENIAPLLLSPHTALRVEIEDRREDKTPIKITLRGRCPKPISDAELGKFNDIAKNGPIFAPISHSNRI